MTDIPHKTIWISITLFMLIALIVIISAAYNSSTGFIKKGLNQITTTLNQFDNTNKSLYDGMTINGAEVIDCINTNYKDETYQVVVSTKNYNNNGVVSGASNLVYTSLDSVVFQNATGDDTTNGGEGILTGYPSVDAAGNAIIANTNTGFSASFNLAKASTTATVSGYNSSTKKGTAGYISATAKFTGYVQKDSKNNVRQIIFVQQ